MMGRSLRQSLRLPSEYIEDLELLVEEGKHEHVTGAIKEATNEFEPFLGNLPMAELEGPFERRTLRYTEGGKFDQFLSHAERSEFAAPQKAIRTAVGVYIGKLDYDIENVRSALEQYAEEGDELPYGGSSISTVYAED